VGSLRQRGPVTWPFALPRPAPSRRPRAVLHGSEVARRRARTQARTPPGRRIFQFVPMLTSSSSLRTLPSATGWSSPFGIQRGHPFAVIHGAHPVLRSTPLRRPSVRPASRLLRARLAMRCPGSGRSVRSSGSRYGPCAGVAADLRSSARADRRWRACRRLRSLLVANQWIAETSAVVRPILRGPSPHSLPMESPLVPGAWRGPSAERARKRGVQANGGGPESGSCPHAGRPAGRADSTEAGVSAGIRFHRPGAPLVGHVPSSGGL
jgi:hypothetical protein